MTLIPTTKSKGFRKHLLKILKVGISLEAPFSLFHLGMVTMLGTHQDLPYSWGICGGQSYTSPCSMAHTRRECKSQYTS